MALFGCSTLIDVVRPRIVTLEQTYGIAWTSKHQDYYRALIAIFTHLNYSVRWKVVRLQDWGLAQQRRRLIMIAAAPGEPLPTFPVASHSDVDPSLQPYTTINMALSTVRDADPLHNIYTVKWFSPPMPPTDGNALAVTVTTSGTTSIHPSGQRKFTTREYAALQGFPNNHVFHGTKLQIERQIGNAFAPNTVQVLYRHLEAWLLNVDGITEETIQPIIDLDSMEDVIMIDD